MTCISCGVDMKRGQYMITGLYRGVELSISMPDAYKCWGCGRTTVSGKYSEEVSRKLKEAYELRQRVPETEGLA